ncbi:MAG: glycosyltransferase family 39 protein, partial [Anaerolineaceae bacterium]|nr:glycosyltransferase family 39 protein [Anaerolineaceae bacterium]
MTNTSMKKREWINEALLIGGIFLLNLFLVLPKLQPGMLEINAHDGAKYIESGRLLFDWGLRSLAWGPLVAFIYAPIHLFVGDSPNWFMLETWIGNYILFGMLWLSVYALARQLDKYISKYVIIGLLFGTTVFFPILENQSDALFIPCSILALLFLIRFIETDKLKNLWLASLFVGLGILCRFETILLIITLTAFALIYGLRKHKIFKLLAAAWLPILLLLTLFFSISLATFGGFNLVVEHKSYVAFNDNQRS